MPGDMRVITITHQEAAVDCRLPLDTAQFIALSIDRSGYWRSMSWHVAHSSRGSAYIMAKLNMVMALPILETALVPGHARQKRRHHIFKRF